MKGFVLSVLALSAAFVAAAGIKCYNCHGTTESDCAKEKLEADKAKYLTTCPSGMDRCVRAWAKKDGITAVVKGCATKALCDTAKKLCDDIKDRECTVSCCETDECNAAKSMTPVNVAGVMVPLVIAVVLFTIILVVIKCTKIERSTVPAAQSRGVLLQTIPLGVELPSATQSLASNTEGDTTLLRQPRPGNSCLASPETSCHRPYYTAELEPPPYSELFATQGVTNMSQGDRTAQLSTLSTRNVQRTT